MKGLRSPWLLAVTPAMLCMLPVLAPFTSVAHHFYYHQSGSATTVLAALWLNLVACWLLFATALRLAEFRPWLSALFWIGFIACLPLLLLHEWATLYDTYIDTTNLHIAWFLTVSFLAAVALLWRKIASRLPRLLFHVTGVIGIFAAGWAVTLGQLAIYTVQARSLAREPTRYLAADAKLHATPNPKPRLIWIIMDELGYNPAFAQRLPGLSLPAFDAFAAQATQFTYAEAPGLYTEQVIPELITGHHSDRVEFTASGDYLYFDHQGSEKKFDPQDTIFADGLHAGYHTAIDGWHNPYCRLLAPVLDQCLWVSHIDSVTPNFDSFAPFWTNLTGPARHLWAKLRTPNLVPQSERIDAARHIEDLTTILDAAGPTLADPRLNLVLIHLPVPHPWGIYDRHRGAFTVEGPAAPSSYVDNLVLADKLLAQLRAALTARGEWDSSTILLMGDHSWRTIPLWEDHYGWTAEDLLASYNGGYDTRPAYLVKLPGQRTAATYDSPFETVSTRALLQAIMQGQVAVPSDLERWAAKSPSSLRSF